MPAPTDSRPQRFAPPIVTVTVKRLDLPKTAAEPDPQPKAPVRAKEEGPDTFRRSERREVNVLNAVRARERERDRELSKDRKKERHKGKKKGGKRGRRRD